MHAELGRQVGSGRFMAWMPGFSSWEMITISFGSASTQYQEIRNGRASN
jgi:hypothetical protein